VPLLAYSPESTYYFFSTGAQSVAAIVGLTSAMAIFRYQSLLNQIDQIQVGLLERFHPMVYPYLQKQGLSLHYDAITMPERRMDYLYERLQEYGETPEFTAYLAQHVFGIAVDEDLVDEKTKPLRQEVNYHGRLVKQAIRFRRAMLAVSAFGLVLLGCGLAATLAPSVTSMGPSEHVTLKLLFGAGLAVYMALVFWLTRLTFQKLAW
jgi:hypothetical protein